MANDQYDTWKACFKEAQSLLMTGSYDAACSACLDALRIAETGCVSAAELAETLEGLALTRMLIERDADVAGLLDRAETVHHQSLEETLAKFGNSHPKTAQAYSNLATHHLIRRCTTAALSCYEQVLEIKQRAFGEQHFEVANTLMIMGGIHPIEAEKTKLWQRAVSVLEYLLAHPDQCDADSSSHVSRALRGGLENLALQAYHENLFADAEEYFRRALATCPTTGSQQTCTLCNAPAFGKVLLAQQKFDEAELFLTEAVANGPGFTRRACADHFE